MGYRFGALSRQNLKGVHPTMQRIAERAIQLTTVDFRITEGLRTFERQQELFRTGKSKTMNSKHLQGFAVDVVALPDNKVSWEWRYYEEIAKAFKQAAQELRVPIVWGGDWKTFKDGVHFELSVAAVK